MAIDKAIDSVVLDANLTTVADAIRAKGGTSDPLSFPTGFTEAIAAIEAGGGGAKVTTGTFTLTEDMLIPYYKTATVENSVCIEHGLGKKPYFYAVFMKQSHNAGVFLKILIGEQHPSWSEYMTLQSCVQYNGSLGVDSSYTISNVDASQLVNSEYILVNCPLNMSDVMLKAGQQYMWYAACLED